MTDTTTELAETIAEIFNNMGWIWGLEQAGIPEHVPSDYEIAGKIRWLQDRPHRQVTLASHGRIVLADDPEYPDHTRVLLDIGELHKTEGT